MPLVPGTWLGPYEVLAPLGAGGMGQVFRGRDSRLGRDVAIKVLLDEAANDSKALARFAAEAKAVASLSHPNILAIHDVGESNGVRYAVTELLDGQTLRAALRDGSLPQRRALEIAQQIAVALAAAHDSGLVHRDIKPENVFLTRDGHVKVLDFGLARREPGLQEGNDTQSPTRSALTGANTIVGTVAYMSPEQARGLRADYRSDQFSLGIVLYEMLCGARPFHRESAAETLSAIIREEPEPLSRCATGVAAPVRFLVERLLSKDPEGRYDSSRDLARELEIWRLHSSEISPGHPLHSEAARPEPALVRRPIVLIGIATSVLAGVFVLAFLTGRRPGGLERYETVVPLVRSSIDIRPATSLTPSTALEQRSRVYRGMFALAPDGRHIAYSATQDGVLRLFIRRLDREDAVPVPGSEDASPVPGAASFGRAPFFSQDGSSIAFWARGGLWRVPLSGGTPVPLLENEWPPSWGACFTPDGAVLFSRWGTPILKATGAGKQVERITQLDAKAGEWSHRLPNLLPGGKALIFTVVADPAISPEWRIAAQSLPNGEKRILVEGASDGRYVPTGHLVYAREGALFAAPFDPERLAITGPEFGLVGDVMHALHINSDSLQSGVAQYSFSESGTLAYVPGGIEPPERTIPAWVDASGRTTPLEGLPPATYYPQGLSPDRTKLLFYESNRLSRASDKIFDLRRGTMAKTSAPENCWKPVWAPDGQRLAWSCGAVLGDTIKEVPLAGGEPHTLVEGAGFVAPVGYTPGEKELCYERLSSKGGIQSVWLMPLPPGSGEHRLIAEVKSPARIFSPSLSPDGALLAYEIDAPDRYETYIRSLGGEGESQLVTVGGRNSTWAPNGRALFFMRRAGREAAGLFAVAVSASRPPVLGDVRRLFDLPKETLWTATSFPVSADGQRFLITLVPKVPDPPPLAHINLVQSWFQEIKGRTTPSGH